MIKDKRYCMSFARVVSADVVRFGTIKHCVPANTSCRGTVLVRAPRLVKPQMSSRSVCRGPQYSNNPTSK